MDYIESYPQSMFLKQFPINYVIYLSIIEKQLADVLIILLYYIICDINLLVSVTAVLLLYKLNILNASINCCKNSIHKY